MSDKKPPNLKTPEVDPLFANILEAIYGKGNTTIGKLQKKVEEYIDSRIELKL